MGTVAAVAIFLVVLVVGGAILEVFYE